MAKQKSAKKVLKPTKGLTASYAENMSKKMLKLPNENIRELVLDFKKVDTIDSVGLGLVLAAHNTISKADGRLQLINVTEGLFNLFHVMGLERHFEIQPL